MKHCKCCGMDKTLKEFYKNKKNKDGLQHLCRLCHTDKERRNRYGIGNKEYNALFKNQNGSCAICKRHQTEFVKALHIDHCHTTGKVRGLLCNACNMGLGKFEDDAQRLLTAMNYLG